MAKTVFIKVRVTKEEREFLKNKSDTLGKSMSDLIRMSFDDKKYIFVENKKQNGDIVKQLAKIGNNLNQIARWANTEKSNADAVQIIAHLKCLEEAVKDIKTDAY